MAINFLNTVDLNFNQLNKAAIQNLGTDPAAGVLGQIYYNTAVSALKICTTAQVIGGANAVYTEVGATSGVETISIGNANVNAGGVNTGLVRTPGTGIGDVVITPAIYGGAANVGMVPTGGTAGKYLDGAGNWLDVSTGDITGLTQGIYITIDNPNGPVPTIKHNLTSRTDTTSTSSPGSAGTFTSVDSVTTNTTGHVSALNLKTVTLPTSDNYGSWTLDGDTGTPQNIVSGNTATFTGQTKITTAVAATDVLTITHDSTSRTDTTSTVSASVFPVVNSVSTDSTGHVTAIDIKTVTVPDNNDNTTYTLPTTNGNNPDIVLTGFNPSTTDIVNMNGTGSTVKVTGSGTNTLTFDLVDNVTIAGDLTVSGGDITLGSTGRIQGVDTVQDPTDAASKSYVDQSNIGQSVFQGGYNAATNTPDLDVSPATNIKKGFFWAVTDTGDFFSEEVQPGDLIYADQDNPGATFANWVVVQSGQDIATAGASDGATIKGIAGFNSAHFNVTSNGWVSSDIYGGGSTLGIVPSGGTSSKFLRGDGSFEVPDYVSYSAMNTTTLGLGRLRYAIGATPAANSQSTTAGRTYGVTKNASDQLIVNVPWLNTEYSMMTSTVLGLGKLFSNTTQAVAGTAVSATASRTYGIQKNSSNQLVVNVPWVNTNSGGTITSVVQSTATEKLGISVTTASTTATVGLDIDSLTAHSSVNSADELVTYSINDDENKKVSILQLENYIGAARSKRFILNTTTTDVSQQVSPPGGTIGWVVDAGTALGVTTALDCMVEIIATSGGATVYAEITRSSADVTINFSGTVSQGDYQALITRIY